MSTNFSWEVVAVTDPRTTKNVVVLKVEMGSQITMITFELRDAKSIGQALLDASQKGGRKVVIPTEAEKSLLS